MIERLMVPTDGSTESDRAIAVAEQLATASAAEVLLVQVVKYPSMVEEHSYDGMGWPEMYQRILDLEREDAQANLDRLSARFRAAGATSTAAILEGSSVAASLLDFEAQHRPDLVVMASHGRSGLARFALGSVADRMVREGCAPVLVVRADPSPRLLSALVMLDGSGVAEEALAIVAALAGRPIQQVKLFRAVADPDDRPAARTYLDGVAGRLAPTGVRIDALVDLGDPTVLIARAARDVDLVILCTHGRGGIDRFRHGSVAERVVRESERPVLLVRAGMPAPRRTVLAGAVHRGSDAVGT